MDTREGRQPETAIIIRSAPGRAYAWDETGLCLGRSGLRMIAERFTLHPALSDLVDLDYAFWSWAARDPAPDATVMQWREFHLDGLILARRLADMLRGCAVPVYYRTRHPSPHRYLNIGPL